MIELRGGDQLAALSKALKEAGDKALRRELSRGISKATRPFIKAARGSAQKKLPQRGGLAKRVARTPIRTVRRVGGVSVQARSSYHLKLLDEGVTAHPVFGNRNRWVTQNVPAGWWTEPAEAMLPEVRRQVEEAMEAVVKQIDRSV